MTTSGAAGYLSGSNFWLLLSGKKKKETELHAAIPPSPLPHSSITFTSLLKFLFQVSVSSFLTPSPLPHFSSFCADCPVQNQLETKLPESSLFFFCLFAFSGAAPAAYGGSQARGLIGAVDAGLHHRHSNAGSERNL